MNVNTNSSPLDGLNKLFQQDRQSESPSLFLSKIEGIVFKNPIRIYLREGQGNLYLKDCVKLEEDNEDDLNDRLKKITFRFLTTHVSCPTIHSLTMNPAGISRENLMKIWENCPNLTTLLLTGDRDGVFDDDHMIQLALKCTQLKIVALNSCSKITDCGIIVLANRCTQLEQFRLSLNDEITDSALKALGKNLSMERACFNKCSQVTISGAHQFIELADNRSIHFNDTSIEKGNHITRDE
jgi:hypothetical protein